MVQLAVVLLDSSQEQLGILQDLVVVKAVLHSEVRPPQDLLDKRLPLVARQPHLAANHSEPVLPLRLEVDRQDLEDLVAKYLHPACPPWLRGPKTSLSPRGKLLHQV